MRLYDIQEPGESDKTESIGSVSRDIVVGIDLGTTNSLIGYAQNGQVTIIPDQFSGKPYTPSVVAYEGDKVLVGEQALACGKEPINSIKRLMGKVSNDVLGSLTYKVDAVVEGMPKVVTQGRKITPIEVSAEILKYLKQRAESHLNQAVTKAVITVPAYFDESARHATRDAARLAGIEVLRLISEPTAAAIAYGFDKQPEGVYAVYDLGGGTFDISILSMQKGVFQVLATGGNALLGGDDIDRLLSQSLFAEQTFDLKKLIQLRTIKERLSIEGSVISEGVSITRQDLDKLAQPLINETIGAFKRAVKDADIAIASIKEVILVGGATRMPLIHKEVTDLTGKPPLSGINPDEIVAVGAALQAEALVSGSNNLLIDVIPLSLGIEVGDGLVEYIIHRNSAIPTVRVQKFATQKANQTGIVVHVVQGEGAKVRDCRSLARFELKGIPPLPAGQAKVEVRFQIDADGLLLVSARELTTGVTQDIMVKPSYGLTEVEIAALLEKSL